MAWCLLSLREAGQDARQQTPFPAFGGKEQTGSRGGMDAQPLPWFLSLRCSLRGVLAGLFFGLMLWRRVAVARSQAAAHLHTQGATRMGSRVNAQLARHRAFGKWQSA